MGIFTGVEKSCRAVSKKDKKKYFCPLRSSVSHQLIRGLFFSSFVRYTQEALYPADERSTDDFSELEFLLLQDANRNPVRIDKIIILFSCICVNVLYKYSSCSTNKLSHEIVFK